jgi:replicative DNA helicase Mcm
MTSPARVKAGTIQCNNPACDRGGPFTKDLDRSEKTAKRVIQLQENPEGLKGGELPETIGIILTGDLVENISPGNRVVINGIVMLREIKSKAGDTLDYEHYIDAVSVEVIEREFEEIDITPEDERAIRELSKSPTLIEDIRGSIAPTIYGQDDVKEAIALQLVSSPPVSHQDGTRTRGDIHILLVGDPGIAKSQILKYVIGLAPRGVFTSGKGSTAAGLTASAVKDEMSDGRWTIEAGALPMADMGLCAVDEMDKMQDNDRDALHEGLEQQTISVSKAGINATLRCRCSVLAAANPKLGRFDLIEPISSQIKLAPTLLSRFDLIFVLFDTPEQELDSRISSHILNVYMDDSVATPPIPPELLRKYIAYARRTITPQMTQESSKALQEYYLGVRAQYNSGPNQPVPTTARQLQALMRLSVASARLRLSNQVELQDANRAIALTDACLRKVGIDQSTGSYDAGAIDTGITRTQVDAISTLKNIIREICKTNNGIAPALDILKAATEAGLNEDRAQKVLERMRQGTEIMEPRPGYYRLV